MKVFFCFLLSTLIGAFSLSPQNAPVRKVWDKAFGGDKSDGLKAMLPTADGGFLLGGSSKSDRGGDKSDSCKGAADYWIVKIDEKGNKLWDKTLGGEGYDDLSTLRSTPDGGFLLGGSSSSNVGGDKSDSCKGGPDYWIVKIDAQGNKLWDKTFGNNQYDVLCIILPVSNGGFLLGGSCWIDKGAYDYWIIKIDAQGNKLWDKTYGGSKVSESLSTIVATTDGGFLLGGNRGMWWADYWIIKIDAQGNQIWDKSYGGIDDDALATIHQTTDGGYLLAGCSFNDKCDDKSEDNKGVCDYWIIRIDAQGNKLWDKTFGNNDRDVPDNIFPMDDGGFLISGGSCSTNGEDKTEDSRGYFDYWLLRIDADGNKLWDKTYGGDAWEVIFSVLSTSNNSFLLGGTSYSTKSGDKSEACRGEGDFWIIKIAIEPNGIAETTASDNGLKVYPNPSDGTLTISYPDNCTLELFDTKGTLLRTLLVQDSPTELTGLATGLYLLRVTTDSGKTLTQKIIVN
jgi:hypothetical protein